MWDTESYQKCQNEEKSICNYDQTLCRKIVSDESCGLNIIIVNFSRFTINSRIVNSNEVENRIILILEQSCDIQCDVIVTVFHVDAAKLRNRREISLFDQVMSGKIHGERIENLRHISQDEIWRDNSHIDGTGYYAGRNRKRTADHDWVVGIEKWRAK
jgi:hypothetical protein